MEELVTFRDSSVVYQGETDATDVRLALNGTANIPNVNFDGPASLIIRSRTNFSIKASALASGISSLKNKWWQQPLKKWRGSLVGPPLLLLHPYPTQPPTGPILCGLCCRQMRPSA